MPDVDILRKAVNNFVFDARIRGNSSNPCTVQDINSVIGEISKVLNIFIDELEHDE